MIVVGLTGGIGSGKTTVANFFQKLGVPVYIADIEAKRLMNESAQVRSAITAVFGEKTYSNNLLDNKYLASKVFQDKEKLETLNSIVHPEVRKDFELWTKKQNSSYVIYEAAILFEKGGHKNCDFTILVTADREARIARLRERHRSSLKEIEARMLHQWPDEKKELLADFIIKNDDLLSTYENVVKIHDILKGKA